jgi:hypothetical protein
LNFWTRFINFIRGNKKVEIPFEIQENELLVRGIVHPYFYSNKKSKLKPEAYLPASNKNDVSLLRHFYTNDDFCKKHSSSLRIGEHEYCGMSTFLKYHVQETINNIPISERISVEVVGSPMDDNQRYINNPPVFTNDPGLPMHADLIYEIPVFKGVPSTLHRKFASELVKQSNYFNDPNVNSPTWLGEKLAWKSKD